MQVSKRKAKDGRLQGEKWMDPELDLWKQQALRVLAPEPQRTAVDFHIERKKAEVFKLEATLNNLKYERQRKQREKAALEGEVAAIISQEHRDSNSGAGASSTAILSTLREKIQECNQNMFAAGEIKLELEKEEAVAFAEMRASKQQIEAAQSELGKYSNDCELLRVQIRTQFHDVEKVLAQGKLMTMAEIHAEFQGKYRAQIADRQRLIHKQQRLKEMLRDYEEKVVVMTRLMQMQYDPNRDSPRRNELKRKGVSFEQVFKTMMERIGESDIGRIVELFQKQELTFNAWTEAVRDQEVRVKLLEEEKRLMAGQLKKIAAKKSHGVENEIRQVTMDGQKLDMAMERIDTAACRLKQLDGLMAHVKESIRHTLLRVSRFNPSAPLPPPIIPDDGEGGVGEWIAKLADVLSVMAPSDEQLASLNDALEDCELELGVLSQVGGSEASGTTSGAYGARSASSPKTASSPFGTVAQKLRRMSTFIQQSDMPMVSPLGRRTYWEDKDSEDSPQADLNLRIQFPQPLSLLREAEEKEKEAEEQELRAEALDDSVLSRDEVKRRNARLVKQKDRERAEKEAEMRGEKLPVETNKPSKSNPPKAPKSSTSPLGSPLTKIG